MDSLFMEQHFLRSSLRLYPGGDPMDSENNNGSLFSAAMMEKARAHLQLWGRYSPGDLHAMLLSGAAQQMYPRAVPTSAWGQPGAVSPWGQPGLPGLPPGLLGPPPPPSHHRPQITPPPSTTPSSGSPSPTSPSSAADLRLPKPVYSSHRFSPYSQAMARQLSPTSSSPRHH